MSLFKEAIEVVSADPDNPTEAELRAASVLVDILLEEAEVRQERKERNEDFRGRLHNAHKELVWVDNLTGERVLTEREAAELVGKGYPSGQSPNARAAAAWSGMIDE